MMLASKNEEVSFIHIDSVVKNITYDKFAKCELLQTQLTVLQIIGYQMNNPTIYELCSCGFRFL